MADNDIPEENEDSEEELSLDNTVKSMTFEVDLSSFAGEKKLNQSSNPLLSVSSIGFKSGSVRQKKT